MAAARILGTSILIALKPCPRIPRGETKQGIEKRDKQLGVITQDS